VQDRLLAQRRRPTRAQAAPRAGVCKPQHQRRGGHYDRGGAGDGQVGGCGRPALQRVLQVVLQLPHLQVRRARTVRCSARRPGRHLCEQQAQLLGQLAQSALAPALPGAWHPATVLETCVLAPVSVLPGRPACTCVRLPSAAPARPARRTPEEFGAQLRRALAEEPAPMAPQERRALTWEAATERFLDVAELTEAERPRGLGAALEAATYAAVNTLSGARPRPCLRPRVRAGGRCGFCPTRGSLRSGELGAAPAAPSRRLRVRLSCSQLSRQAGGCAASCCAASWRRRAQSGHRRGGAADHGRRRPGHARQPGLADGLCARYRRQRRHLRQQGARRRAHAPVRRARLMI